LGGSLLARVAPSLQRTVREFFNDLFTNPAYNRSMQHRTGFSVTQWSLAAIRSTR
jgi:hypothetical protein